jgi:hypothetical protein
MGKRFVAINFGFNAGVVPEQNSVSVTWRLIFLFNISLVREG